MDKNISIKNIFKRRDLSYNRFANPFPPELEKFKNKLNLL